MIRAHILISGSVQGVGFRYFIKKKADELGLAGWVRNTSYGKVEVLLQGRKEQVQAMLAFCKEGPPLAEVKEIHVAKLPPGRDLTGFAVD